jgi:zinc transporter ZupT
MKLVLLTALGVGGATAFGALIGFIFKKLSHRFSDIVLSFAAGVMLAAAVLGLILPSLEYGGKFGLLYAAVVFLIEKTGSVAGTGFFAVSFLSGIPDTAAVVMSLSNQAESSGLSFPLATLGVLVGVLSNTIIKFGIALFIGKGAFRKYVSIGFGTMILANAALIAWFAL